MAENRGPIPPCPDRRWCALGPQHHGPCLTGQLLDDIITRETAALRATADGTR